MPAALTLMHTAFGGGPATELGLLTQSVVTEKNGDVVFECVAVDKNKVPNRNGFVFDWDEQKDVLLDAFMANPVMFYMHDSMQIPIGLWERAQVTNKAVRLQGRIPNHAADPDLAAYDAENVAPVRGAVRKGLLRMVSIGFYLKTFTEEKQGDDPKAKTFYRVKSFELVECSVVTIGAHATALIKQSVPAPPTLTTFTDTHWDKTAVGDGDVLYTLSLARSSDEPAWRAIPYERHGQTVLSPVPWVGSREEMAGASPEQLAVMCALENPFKLPHHKADGALSEEGTLSAMAVLLGARGGVKDVPDAERKAAWEHLARHYDELGRDVMEYREYTQDELLKLHERGDIRIPGAVVSATIQLDGLASVRDSLERLADQMESLERMVSAILERTAEPDEEPAPVAPEPAAPVAQPSAPLDEDAVRQAVRAALVGQSGTFAKDIVATLKRKV
jgi:hypothetical protein